MKQIFKRRLLRTLILALIAFAIGAGYGLYVIKFTDTFTMPTNNMQPIAGGDSIKAEFSLTDHNGAVITQDTYKDNYKLIYFGFTFCPDICPTELQKISKVMANLGNQADTIQPLFISIDPLRDTPAVLREYVPLFHPRLIGLTGTEDDVDDAIKNFKIYAARVQEDGANDYTVNHSSYIYLVSPNNQLVSLYGIDDSADAITKDIKRLINP